MNATYAGLIWELVDDQDRTEVSPRVRRLMRRRSLITLVLFGGAALIALRWPIIGLAICIACLAVYLRPEARA